ncbi:MAG: GNAT family N-acetyltransferase [Planctomycetes bacterium]|nr:GNAT family N-acetyltransferase [Planctomycetota bacterium]
MSVPYSVSTVAPEFWDALLLQFPTRQVFHRRAWLQVLVQVHGLKLTLLRIDAGSRLVGLWPVLSLRKGPLTITGSPLPGWSTAYLGPMLVADCDADAALAEALQHRALRSASYVETRVVHVGQSLSLLPHRFERLLEFETYLLDLARPQDTVWQGLESRCRNTVRKAQKNGVTVRTETDASFLDQFWEQSLAVFANSGLTPGFSRELLQAMWRELVPAGLLTVFSAFHDGRRAASVMILHDDQTAYYWAGATDQDLLPLSPNNLLLWEAIVAMQARGIRTLDMVSSSGNAGKFKRSFGPVAAIAAVHWGRSRTRFEGWLKRTYENFVRWRRRAKNPPAKPEPPTEAQPATAPTTTASPAGSPPMPPTAAAPAAPATGSSS